MTQELNRLLVLTVALAAGAAPAVRGATGAVPAGVSPGDAVRFARAAGSCPTFSWAAVEERAAHELVVYGVGADGAPEAVRPALAAQLPAGAAAWTPPAERCLAPGRYAWSVRAGGGPWSAALLFEVAAGPDEIELAEALETLRRHLTEDPEGSLAESLRALLPEPRPVAGGVAPGLATSRSAAPPAEGPTVPAALSDTGIDRASASPQTFNVTNSGGGGMTVQVDGVEVVTTATDQDTLGGLSCAAGQLAKQDAAGSGWECAADTDTEYGAGNQLDLTGTTFDVLEGSGSGLDADLLDGQDGTDFAGAAHTHGFATLNTAVGDNTLTANTTGLGNTAAGANSLANNTTGYNNSALGQSALFDNTTGHQNTAVGTGALINNTTSSFNTALGQAALFSNTTGYEQTAVGQAALLLNTSGVQNTAVGQGALRANTAGHRNTAVGHDALSSNTSGGQNAVLGQAALAANTTGYRNTAVGQESLFSNTEGFANTAVGWHALYNNLTGTDNVALGHSAGFNTTGSHNIVIGTAGATGSYTTRIGYSQTAVYVAGIHGAGVDGATDVPVLVDSFGRLGTTTSSRRFKEEIEPLGEASERLLELRPVRFRFTEQEGEGPPQYGLIAEEVVTVFPELVVADEEGHPLTVRYHQLVPLLLNEVQRLERELAARLEQLEELVANRRPGEP